jgi:hypothetical protein
MSAMGIWKLNFKIQIWLGRNGEGRGFPPLLPVIEAMAL